MSLGLSMAQWQGSGLSQTSVPVVDVAIGLMPGVQVGGASYDLKPNIAVFGSISRTLGVAAEEGAGTTLGFGLSWSAATTAFTR
jgi:hypothetical protein